MKPKNADPAAPSEKAAALALVGLVLKGVWTAFVIATPVLGAWVASSLAAYANGPVALAAASGLLAFPVLPLAWEALSGHRRKKKKVQKAHILTFGDRLVLRTLAVNLLFLGLLVGTRPQAAFGALSTRGDWMLDGSASQTAESIRKRLFWAADRLEWVYLAVHENPFEKPEDLKDPERPTGTGDPKPVPSPTVSAPSTAAPKDAPSPDRPAADTPSSDKPSPDKPSPDKPVADSPAPDKPSSDRPAAARWPAPAALHPVVASMPADAESTIAGVARYIAERETDPAGRFRAAHDWVADRIAYDVPAYLDRRIPAQDAQSVFQRRIGVCAGYARLLQALGREMGLEVEYVVGDARTSGTDERGESHAWTAVKLEGRHYLADATWNAGFPDGRSFKKSFRTDYLFTPPEVFGIDHFPNQERWQLRDKPISRGDFFRQAMMTPRFHAEGRELLSPRRSQVTVSGPFTAEIKTAPGLFTLATWSPLSGEDRNRCKVENAPVTRVTCELPGNGRYLVRLFSSAQQYGTFDFIGQFEANRE